MKDSYKTEAQLILEVFDEDDFWTLWWNAIPPHFELFSVDLNKTL